MKKSFLARVVESLFGKRRCRSSNKMIIRRKPSQALSERPKMVRLFPPQPPVSGKNNSVFTASTVPTSIDATDNSDQRPAPGGAVEEPPHNTTGNLVAGLLILSALSTPQPDDAQEPSSAPADTRVDPPSDNTPPDTYSGSSSWEPDTTSGSSSGGYDTPQEYFKQDSKNQHPYYPGAKKWLPKPFIS